MEDWLWIDIYNLLLDYVDEDKADEIAKKIMDRIKHPEKTKHIRRCNYD